LGKLRDGVYSRAIYLTGKSTGQLEVVQQLEKMLPEKDSLRYIQLRNRSEHAIRSELHSCKAYGSCSEGLAENWDKYSIHLPRLFDQGTITVDLAKEVGAQTGICPYEISRAALPYSSFWICDYNYLFAPSSQSVLENQIDYDPRQTLLIIDEAHNLASRVADVFSFEALYNDAESVLSDLYFVHKRKSKLLGHWKRWLEFLKALKPTDRLELTLEYELKEILNDLFISLQHDVIEYDSLSAYTKETLWEIPLKRNIVCDDNLSKLVWIQESGRLSVNCLDAGPVIASILPTFSNVILMSATLSPMDAYIRSIGIKKEHIQYVQTKCDWRDNAYDVAIDRRVDTRLKQREQHYEDTADTIQRISSFSDTPIVVLFPSYQYAETVLPYVKAISPLTRVVIQPRGGSLHEQARFLEESLRYRDVLFLILGSGFSESINVLGGRISHIMVVGPALPQVNPVQNAKLEKAEQEMSRTAAFRDVYQIPAIQKINQALGRFVRMPGQHAKVLLHCKRFAETDYKQLLATEYQTGKLIKTRDDLENWLHGTLVNDSREEDPMLSF